MKTLVFILLVAGAQASGQSLKWHEGVVVLASQKVLTGKLAIEPYHDLVLFEYNGTRTVIPAHKLQSFYFFDADANINRRFLSMSDQSKIVTYHQLFEIVLQGEVNVLRRQNTKTSNPSDVLDFSYFCLTEDGLLPLRKFKRKIYPGLVPPGDNRLAEYVSSNGLKSTSEQNAIRIIEFHNRLVISDQAIAKH